MQDELRFFFSKDESYIFWPSDMHLSYSCISRECEHKRCAKREAATKKREGRLRQWPESSGTPNLDFRVPLH